jgi:pilus assembly protein CpaE
MSPQKRVLVVTEEPETAQTIASAFEQNGHYATEEHCRDLPQLVARLEGAPAPAVLVDIDPEPTRMLSELDPIISRFADTRFVVLSAAQRSDFILEAMQIGVRHYLIKQSIGKDLNSVLRRLIPNGTARPGKEGILITMLSAGGGCGATTIAVNVANELHLIDAEPALVVDLDSCYGAAAGYLGLEGEYGLADVLANRERIDAELIRSTALEFSKGLGLLASPASVNPTAIAPLEYGHLGPALDACKHAYRYTVVDAPRVPLDVAASLARESQATFIVFQLAVKDIRIARSMASALTNRGIPADRITGLANRYRKRGSIIGLNEARAALGGLAVECISNDHRSAIRAVNYGQPLAQAAPRSSLRRDVRLLATKLAEAYSRQAAFAKAR